MSIDCKLQCLSEDLIIRTLQRTKFPKHKLLKTEVNTTVEETYIFKLVTMHRGVTLAQYLKIEIKKKRSKIT
jgi:hypothetical protein